MRWPSYSTNILNEHLVIEQTPQPDNVLASHARLYLVLGAIGINADLAPLGLTLAVIR